MKIKCVDPLGVLRLVSGKAVHLGGSLVRKPDEEVRIT